MPAKLAKGLDYNHAELWPNAKMLSSSQVLLYLESPFKFFQEHFLGLRRAATQPMNIGKVFSAMFADRKFKWREALKGYGVTNARIYNALEAAIAAFPVFPKKWCEYPLKCKYRGWKFRATLDGLWDGRIDIENKTGTVPWTQERADDSEQVTFQYWVKWKRDGFLFEGCQLNWVDLRAGASQLVHTFNTHRTLEQVMEFEKLVDRVIDGIELEAWED